MIGRLLAALLAVWSAAAQAANWCWNEAATAQNVSPLLLRAIAAEESHCRPAATGKPNPDGSIDRGPLQINSSWLTDSRFVRQGVRAYDLHEPCKAAYIAAWVVASCFEEHGVTWRGVGCYNAKTYHKQMSYAVRIHARLQRYYRTGQGLC